MTSPSRNDPCPCGSGRKFKRCCGATGALALLPVAQSTDSATDSDASYDEKDQGSAYERLVDFGVGPEFDHHRLRCYERLWGPYADRLRDPDHELRKRVPMIANSEVNHGLVDTPLAGGRTILQAFLERERAVLTPGQRRFLGELSRSCVSLYEIVRVEPGRGFELLDLWRSEHCWVHERLASQQLDRWDLIGARLLTRPDGRTVIDSDLWPYHPGAKAQLIAGLEREHAALRRVRGDVPAEVFLKSSAHVFAHVFARNHFEPENPELTTFDGEPVEPTRLLFEVHDLRALRRRLAACRDLDPSGDHEFVWGQTKDDVSYGLGWVELPTLDRRELVATAMSRAHARELRAVLERAGRTALAWRSERTFTIAEWAQQGGALRAPTASAPRHVDDSLARALEERHYRDWPDVSLPALDGHTPRAAAQDEALRPRVVEVLKSLEHSQRRRARSGGPAPLDLTDLWRTLGLEPPTELPAIVPAHIEVVDLHEWTRRYASSIVSGKQGARFERYSSIVQAAGDAPRGEEVMTERACSRRPNRKKCVGRIQVLVHDDQSLRWRCGACGDAQELVGWKALLEAIQSSARKGLPSERPARRVDAADPWGALYAAAVEFRELAPWRWLVDEQVFGVEDPATGEVGWCCTLGGAGELEGLAIYLGDSGFDRWRRTHETRFLPDEGFFGQDALVLSFADRASVSHVEHERLRSLGLKFRGRRAWPSIESQRFGRLPRSLDAAEATRLTHTLDQALTIARRAAEGERAVGPDADGRYLVRRLVRTGGAAARWSDERIEPPKPVVLVPPPLDGAAVERLRNSLPPRPGRVWEVDVVPIPAPIEEPGIDAYLPAGFLAIEREGGYIVHFDMQAPSDLCALVQTGLLDAVRARGERPAKVCVRRPWVADALARVADALGIRVEVRDQLEVLESAVEQLGAFLAPAPRGVRRESRQRGG